eukprot:366391-Chlamydomonas_euryale.AAC.1
MGNGKGVNLTSSGSDGCARRPPTRAFFGPLAPPAAFGGPAGVGIASKSSPRGRLLLPLLLICDACRFTIGGWLSGPGSAGAGASEPQSSSLGVRPRMESSGM